MTYNCYYIVEQARLLGLMGLLLFAFLSVVIVSVQSFFTTLTNNERGFYYTTMTVSSITIQTVWVCIL